MTRLYNSKPMELDEHTNQTMLPKSIYNRSRICKEIILFYSVYYLPGLFAQQGGFNREAFGTVGFNLWILIMAVPQMLLLLYVLELQEPETIGSLGLSFASRAFIPRMAVTLAGLFAVAFTTSWIVESLAAGKAVFGATGSGTSWHIGSIAIVPLLLLSSLAIGYREELFFRAYLMTRLDQMEVTPAAAVALSAILFAAGHAYEGVAGTSVALASGIFLALAYRSGRNLHQVAIAHGLYNFAILILSGTR